MSRDLPVVTTRITKPIFVPAHLYACTSDCVCVCGLVLACVMSVLWVGKGSLPRQTALWSAHQVSNCPLLHTTSRKPQKNMNKLVCLTMIASPSFPPSLPPSLPHPPLSLGPVCLQLHTLTMIKQLFVKSIMLPKHNCNKQNETVMETTGSQFVSRTFPKLVFLICAVYVKFLPYSVAQYNFT